MRCRMIRNCQFKFECDRKWGDLLQIRGEPGVRYCTQCLQEVHFVDNWPNLVLAMKEDWCVAIPRTLVIEAKAVKSINEPLMGSLVPVMHGRE